MSFHTNYTNWRRMTDPEHCPVCANTPMPPGMVDVVELPCSWLSAEPRECLRGACHLTAKRHVVELYELTDQELLGLMRDLKRCARALHTVTSAVKINYEIHGNSLPHLHIHLYPRYLDDPFPGRPINYHQKSTAIYREGEFERFVDELREEILSTTTD